MSIDAHTREKLEKIPSKIRRKLKSGEEEVSFIVGNLFTGHGKPRKQWKVVIFGSTR